MKKGRTHLTSILDRSGSVHSVIDEMRGSYNSYLDEQEKFGDDCTVTTVIFDDKVDVIDEFVNIKSAQRLTESNYFARSWTAMFDAIGIAIVKTGEKLAALPEDERPEFVFVYINTDGLENKSTEYSRQQIRKMIEHQEKVYNWKFLFIGANIDAFEEANSISVAAAANYQQTSSGINTMSANLNYSVANARSYGNLKKSADVEDYFNVQRSN